MDSRLEEIPELININGEILFNEPMKNHTSFRIGGNADAYIIPSNKNQLICAITALREKHIPFFILGGGANILVSDQGIRGVVFDLCELQGISLESVSLGSVSSDGSIVTAEAGLSVNDLCTFCANHNLAGLENFYGMPGSVGGSVWMNARCYERSFSDSLCSVETLGLDGEIHNKKVDSEQFGYKKSPFQKDGSVILSSSFVLLPGKKEDLIIKMQAFRKDRVDKGHFDYPCAGSLFKNNRAFGQPTGQIIDSLGLKGFCVGDAAIADYHANIFINKGKATATDMRALIRIVQEKVKEKFGFDLEPEVLLVGQWDN